MSASYQQLYDKLKELGQGHVFAFWPELNEAQREDLLAQTESLDLVFLADQRKKRWPVGDEPHHDLTLFKPFPFIPLPTTDLEKKERLKAIDAGEALLAQGKTGIIVVAGGQGTRLGFDGPKGTFPVGPITGRTLFQYHIEKICALENKFGCVIPFYVMTSPGNHDDTLAFFKDKKYFGKSPESVICFPQRMLPVFDAHGRILLEEKHRLSFSPDGHGGLLYAMRKHGILDDMIYRGLEQIYYFQVDNVLANICDPAFIGDHMLADADMSARTVYKRDAEEPLGNIGLIDDVCTVIEYSELPKKLKENRNPDDTLVFGQGSIAIHMFAVEFLKRLTFERLELAYHVARKTMPFVDESGRVQRPEEKNAVKFEQFIFDAFQYAEKIMVQETHRAQDFSPIKNLKGVDSPATAMRDLQLVWASWLDACGLHVPRHHSLEPRFRIEISPKFAHSAGELCRKLPTNLDFNEDLLLE